MKNNLLLLSLLSWLGLLSLPFTARAAAPSATTLAASGVTATNATLNGTVNPSNATTIAYFRYGLTTNYGSFSATNSLAAVATNLSVTNLISSLSPGTTYHFQLVASNSAGTANGADLTFTTPVVPRAFTGAAPGQGLDLQGNFVYAVNVGNNGAPGLIGDANFTADSVPGVSITVPGGTLNTIDTWATPNFGTNTEALRLAQAMSSIRWASRPDILIVNLAGLQVGRSYQLQLLFIESCCDRMFDVKVNGTIIIPSFRLLDYGAMGTAIVIPYVFTVTGTNALIELGGGAGAPDPTLSAFTLEVLSPVVTTLAASGVTTTNATLNGTVNPNGAATTAYFRYGLTTNYGSFSATNNLAATNLTLSVSNLISGLSPGTTYHFQLVASNSLGVASGADLTFTTSPLVPTVTTLAATGVTATNATLNGTVNPGGGTTTAYFQYGLTTNYGSFSATNSLVATNTALSVSSLIGGLSLGTTYHFRLLASNSAGSTNGANLTFTTSPLVPTVTTLAATGVTATNATLNGTVNPGGGTTTVYFRYGWTTNYGSFSATNSLAATNLTLSVSNLISGLSPGTTYHFRLVASNSSGSANGADLTFTTVGSLVTTTSDAGAGSLRNAINTTPSGGYIYFASNLSGQTITLTSGELLLNQDLTIDGSALASPIHLNGNHNSRIFTIGGGVGVALNSLLITNCFLPGTDRSGGAIFNGGNLTINNSTFVSNSVDASSSGGAIANYGLLTLNGCTFSGNSASFSGAVENRSTCTANNCTFYGNTAVAGNGGAIDNAFQATLSLLHCTFYGNSASQDGGAIDNYLSQVSLTNTILAASTPNDIYNWDGSTTTAGGLNIVQALANDGTLFGANAILAQNPLLGPLANYGGPTPTMPPLPGSPGIDNGSDTATNLLATDQRGLPRLSGLHVDIGAVESAYLPSAPAVVTLPATGQFLTDATLNATVTPNGAATVCYFQYGLTTNYGLVTATNTLSAGTAAVAANLTGLTPAALYHFRAVVANSAGSATGADLTFTPADRLTVTTLAATGMSNTVATLNGTVNPNSAATTAWFEWGPAANNYSQQTAPVSVGSGAAALAVSNLLSGLTPGVIYHYRVVASNVFNLARGQDTLFGSPALFLNGAAFVTNDFVTNECHSAFSDPAAAASSGLLAIAGGLYHSLALRSDGTVAAWGDNGSGQTTIPVGLSNVVAIAAGDFHSLALKRDGTVAAWGDNGLGQTTIPVGLSNVVAIAASYLRSLALPGDGTIVGWGQNNYGETTMPAGLSNVVAIAAGYNHSLALKRDGTVVAWGVNSATQTNIPAGLSNVVAIAAGDHHSLALKNDGTVVAWGYFADGQTSVPAGLNNVVAIAGGGAFVYRMKPGYSLALKSDGTVVAWEFWLLRQGIPADLSDVVAIAGGGEHALALKSDGTVIAWGRNDYGQATIPAGLNSLPVTVSGSVDPNTPGSYALTYTTSTNSLGGIATVTRTVVVKDTLPPVITVLGNNPFPSPRTVPFVDPGATNLDVCSGIVALTTNSTVNVSVLGTYAVTYTATDSSGNSATNTRVVVVGVPPSLSGLTASVTATNGANGNRIVSLAALVNPNGLATTVNFQYGLTPAYGGSSAPVLPASFAGSNVASSVEFSAGFTYHWRVVAANSLGSVSSPDQTFTLGTPGGGGSGVAGDLNGDGVVSQAELDAVYANYVTNSPWLYMTNVAGLGGTNVSFSLSNTVLGAYSVLYSTNLATWQYLGPATPRYLFTDTNAPALPKRYYRLGYP